GGQLFGRPTVASNADGRQELFAVGVDRSVLHNYQVAPSSGWSGWGSLGGVAASDPAVQTNSDGRLEIYVRGTDGALYHNYRVATNSVGWGGSSVGTENPAERDTSPASQWRYREISGWKPRPKPKSASERNTSCGSRGWAPPDPAGRWRPDRATCRS